MLLSPTPKSLNLFGNCMESVCTQVPMGELRENSQFTLLPDQTARSDTADPQLRASPAVPADEPRIWWIHLWSGLARDPTGKHYRSMGTAIWLYLYLLVSANRTDGVVLRRKETIMLQTGFSETSVSRWLQELRDKGYITSTSNGRALRIQITKWRSTRAAAKTNTN